MVKKRRRRQPYYGKKGGAAEYKKEITFGVYSTLSALKDYYNGKVAENKND